LIRGQRALLIACVVAWSAIARADGAGGLLHELAVEVRTRLAAAVEQRAPRLVPPKPLDVRWKPVRIGTIELGAPLVALVAADLDHDNKAELYAVTTREVVAIAAKDRVKELARVGFVGDAAVPRPRDPVGAAVVEGDAVIASASPWARSLRVTWQGAALRGEPGDPGFELCAGERAQLAPGRNFFGEGAAAYFGVRCADLVDARGAPLHVRAQLSTASKLEIAAGRARRELGNVGAAFVVADLDRDGSPEVIYTSARPPGDPDMVEVRAALAEDRKPRFKKPFPASGVAALAVGDLDGDGAVEVIAAVRLVGATKIDLWRLN
jgi:hypothetical protein